MRFNSSCGLRIFSLPYAADKTKKNIFLYFVTELKTFHLSCSIHSRYQLNNITLPLILETLDNEDYSSAHTKSPSSHARQRPATKSYDKDVSCVFGRKSS